MKLIGKALLFMYVCNIIIELIEDSKLIDRDWKNTINVALFLLSTGYFCLVIFSMCVNTAYLVY